MRSACSSAFYANKSGTRLSNNNSLSLIVVLGIRCLYKALYNNSRTKSGFWVLQHVAMTERHRRRSTSLQWAQRTTPDGCARTRLIPRVSGQSPRSMNCIVSLVIPLVEQRPHHFWVTVTMWSAVGRAASRRRRLAHPSIILLKVAKHQERQRE